jgi:hypothetical protein
MKRGTYRSMHTSIFDDPGFNQLTSPARHVLLTLRLSSPNLACIYRLHLPVLASNTGYPLDTLDIPLKELVKQGWIEWDGWLVWVRNGLKYDPSVSLINPKQADGVKNVLLGLPKCQMILNFCNHYGIDTHDIPMPEGNDTLSPPSPSPSPSPSPNPRPKPIPRPRPQPSASDADFEKFYSIYPKTNHTSRAKTLTAWKSSIKGGATAEVLIAGAEGYAVEVKGKEKKYIKGAQVFLGPGKWWENYQAPKPGEKLTMKSTGSALYDQKMRERGYEIEYSEEPKEESSGSALYDAALAARDRKAP